MSWWVILLIIFGGFFLLWFVVHIARVIAADFVKAKPYVSGHRTTFPDIEDGHVMPKRQKYSYTYDENFDFRYQKGMRKFVRFLVRYCVLSWFDSFVVTSLYGLLIKNKKVFKKHKNLMKDGFITTCNHTFNFDTLAIFSSLFPKYAEFPIWQEGAESGGGMCYRAAGGIPLPKDSIKGMHFSMKAMEEVLNEKGWLHIFPEGSCWYYYAPIREYKLGTFKIAYDTNKPVFPLGMSFRKRKGISRLFTKIPWATLSIGEPIFPDKTLSERESIRKLASDVRNATLRLVGIDSEEENLALKKEYDYVPYVAPIIPPKKIIHRK